jgi:hypothetical protein
MGGTPGAIGVVDALIPVSAVHATVVVRAVVDAFDGAAFSLPLAIVAGKACRLADRVH